MECACADCGHEQNTMNRCVKCHSPRVISQLFAEQTFGKDWRNFFTKEDPKPESLPLGVTLVPTAVKAGTGVIVVKEDRVLIGKRRGSHGCGCYAFPGGHIEPSDVSLKESGEREVFEETGIDCEIFRPDGIRDELFTTLEILSENKQSIYVTTYLIARYKSGGIWLSQHTCEAIEKDKCERWIWVTINELAQLIATPEAKTWIPLDKVVYYLNLKAYITSSQSKPKPSLKEKSHGQEEKAAEASRTHGVDSL